MELRQLPTTSLTPPPGFVTVSISNERRDVLVGDDRVEQIFSELARLENLEHNAERRSMDKVAMDWLKTVKDMTFKVEHWWDELNNHHLLCLHEAAVNSRKFARALLNKVRSCIPYLWHHITNNDTAIIAMKTKTLTDELKKKLIDENNGSNCTRSSRGRYPQLTESPVPTSTTTLFENHPMPPLTEDLEGLVSLISQNNGEDPVRVVSIIGKGGSRKTPLARLFYDHDEIRKSFPLREWASMSETHDEKSIASALLSIADKSSHHSSESMFQTLRNKFSKKKFLLVLDDVSVEDSSIWGRLSDSLKNGDPGGLILVTTRSEIVARAFDKHSSCCFKPRLLEEDASWGFLKVVSGKSEPFCQEVEKTGKNIARKCEGLLLNLLIIGSHLQFKNTIDEWKEAFHLITSSIFSNNFSVFYVSYMDLPPQLKHCFVYLAVFPLGAVIKVEQVIRLWMAEGFLGSPMQRDYERMKKGLEYFNILRMRSFFHELVKGSAHNDRVISFQIHNGLHRFAKYLPQVIKSSDENMGNVRSRRRILVDSRTLEDLQLQNLPREFKYFLRALDLSCRQLREIPAAIGELILLEYLNLSGNPLKQLPETICDLSYLEFLDVHSCYILECLPQRIGELRLLKHLRINYTTDELLEMPQGFEKLTLMRTLDVFRAGGRYDNIGKLKDLNDLEEIYIAIHGRSVKVEDARLNDKMNMQNLELGFLGDGRDMEMVAMVDPVQPPPNLEMLKFEGYPGLQLPTWVENLSPIQHLKRLTIISAWNLVSLPTLGGLASLEFLWLHGIPNLKHLGREFFGLMGKMSQADKQVKAFPSLKTLRVEDLKNWKTWEDLNTDDEENINRIKVMPQLEELMIESCPKLEKLPHRILERISSLQVAKVNGQAYSELRRNDVLPATPAADILDILCGTFLGECFASDVPISFS